MANLCIVLMGVTRDTKSNILLSGIAWVDQQRDDMGTPGWSVSVPIGADAPTINSACRDAAVAAVAPFGLSVNTLTDKIILYGATPITVAAT